MKTPPRVRLTAPEVERLVTYLAKTHVPWTAERLRSGIYEAFRDSIANRTVLGLTPTYWGNLGSKLYAQDLYRRRLFRVGEVWTVLGRNDCDATDDWKRIAALIAAERAGKLSDRLLTMLDDGRGLRFVDGNHRASAVYEANVAPMPLPVVVLVR